MIRGLKVMLDKDLAGACLYKVKPKALRQQVKRNMKRFPNDFIPPAKHRGLKAADYMGRISLNRRMETPHLQPGELHVQIDKRGIFEAPKWRLKNRRQEVSAI